MSGKILQLSGKMLQLSGKYLQLSGKMLQLSGKNLQLSGKMLRFINFSNCQAKTYRSDLLGPYRTGWSDLDQIIWVSY